MTIFVICGRWGEKGEGISICNERIFSVHETLICDVILRSFLDLNSGKKKKKKWWNCKLRYRFLSLFNNIYFNDNYIVLTGRFLKHFSHSVNWLKICVTNYVSSALPILFRNSVKYDAAVLKTCNKVNQFQHLKWLSLSDRFSFLLDFCLWKFLKLQMNLTIENYYTGVCFERDDEEFSCQATRYAGSHNDHYQIFSHHFSICSHW